MAFVCIYYNVVSKMYSAGFFFLRSEFIENIEIFFFQTRADLKFWIFVSLANCLKPISNTFHFCC